MPQSPGSTSALHRVGWRGTLFKVKSPANAESRGRLNLEMDIPQPHSQGWNEKAEPAALGQLGTGTGTRADQLSMQ